MASDSDTEFDEIVFGHIATAPAPKRQRPVVDTWVTLDRDSEGDYINGDDDDGDEPEWSDDEEECDKQADIDQAVRDARDAAVGAPIYNPGGIGRVLSSAFAWIRKGTADEMCSGTSTG